MIARLRVVRIWDIVGGIRLVDLMVWVLVIWIGVLSWILIVIGLIVEWL